MAGLKTKSAGFVHAARGRPERFRSNPTMVRWQLVVFFSRQIAMAPRAEVPQVRGFNGLLRLTILSTRIERQWPFPPLANRIFAPVGPLLAGLDAS